MLKAIGGKHSLPLVAGFCLLLLCFVGQVQSLYFFLDHNDHKCFSEELPDDTVVVGHYMAEILDTATNKYIDSPDLSIKVTVTEQKSDHVVTSTIGPSQGKFAFTSHDAVEHSICLKTHYEKTPVDGLPKVRMHLDIIIGDAKPDNAGRDRAHISDLATRVRELNLKIKDIRKEQQYQREREADFRDLSEKTNSRAVWWSFIQLATLIVTCTWQLRHLKGFFHDKKLN